MKPQWIIHDIHKEDTKFLLDALDHSGTGYELVNTGALYDSKSDYLQFHYNCPIVYFGSINTCLEVQRKTTWIPGPYLNLKNYDCQHYYGPLYQYLLNQDHQFIPFSLLDKEKERLYDRYGVDRAIFIRPDKGSKSFTGQVLYKEKFDTEVQFIKNYHLVTNDDVMCVVARPFNVGEEYRFVVVDDKVVTGSLYKHGADLGRRLIEDTEEPFKFAQNVVSNTTYRPDRAWCLDVCECGDSLYVLEVGGFSCAGLYRCDCTKIVEAVNRVAVEEWKEYYE